MTIRQLIRWRNEAVFSFNAYSIKRFMWYWGIRIPEDETEFWRLVYSAVLRIPEAPRSALIRAEYWLREFEKGGIQND